MNNTDEMDRDIAHALAALDYPVRPASAESIIQEARSRARRRGWRLAAAAAVMLSAAGVAALPGSPARRWLASAFRSITSQQSEKLPAQRDSVVTSATPEMRGVSAEPGASPEISFSDWQESGDIVLRLIPEPAMRIRSPEFPSSYSLRAGNITVRNPGSRASYDVDIAEGARDITVRIAGRTVFRRLNGTVLIGPAPRNERTYVFSLQQGR